MSNPFDKLNRFPLGDDDDGAIWERPRQELPSLSSKKDLSPVMKQGVLKDRYDTSIGQDVLAGMQRGVSMYGGKDPFQMLGATLGGALSALFAKNLAGKVRLEQDQLEVIEYNKQVATQSEAMRRIQVLQDAKDKEAMRRKDALEKQQRLNEYRQSKTDNDKRKHIHKMIQITSGEERRFYQSELSRLDNMDPSILTDTYGVGRTQKRVGDYMYNFSKNGELEVITDSKTGKPITAVSTSELMTILAKENKLNTDNTVDSAMMQSAINQATDIVNAEIKEGTFKYITATGRINNAQKNSHIMAVANKIVKSYKEGKTGRDYIELGNTRFGFDLKPFEVESQDEVQIDSTGKTGDSESAFMKAQSDVELVVKPYTDLGPVNKDWYNKVRQARPEVRANMKKSLQLFLKQAQGPEKKVLQDQIKVLERLNVPKGAVFRTKEGYWGIEVNFPDNNEDLKKRFKENVKAKYGNDWVVMRKGKFYILKK